MMKKYPYHILVVLACCGMVGASVGLCVNAYGVFYTPLCEALGVGRGPSPFTPPSAASSPVFSAPWQ